MPRVLPQLNPMTEDELLKEVKRLAQMFGWWFYHPWTSIRSARGWPDVTLIRPPRLIVAELKRDGKNPTAKQQEVLDLLGKCVIPSPYDHTGQFRGLEVYVWRPNDLEAIFRILR